MVYKILYSHEAINDLMGIENYISINLLEPDIAKKLCNRIKDEIIKLKDDPYIFPNVKKYNYLKRKKVKNFYIIYKVAGKNIEIVRVLYKKRNWEEIL